jgi:hypothetical protein
MTTKYQMMLKVAETEWDDVPVIGQVFQVSDTYRVVGFNGEVHTTTNWVQPESKDEAAKALRWIQRGRPSR